MRICYYSFSIIPSRNANSVHVMKMCQAFAENGHEVVLIVPDVSDFDSDPYEFYGVKHNFQIKKIRYPKIKGKSFIWARRVGKVIEDLRPDVAYGRDVFTAIFLAIRGRVRTGLELHQSMGNRNSIIVKLTRRFLNEGRIYRIVCISESLKKYLVEEYQFLSSGICVAHDGADLNFDNIEKINSIVDNSYDANVGYIGQLYAGKGMEIIEQLVKKMPHVMFHIVGGNDKDIEYWKQKLLNFRNIKFYGYVPNGKVTAYENSCDILVAPYGQQVLCGEVCTEEKDNLARFMSPLKIFEYMALEKVIIASDLSVIREVLTDQQTAYLCPIDDIDSWVDRINNVINHPDEAKLVAENAKVLLTNKYTWKNRAKIIVESMIK